MRHGSPIKLVMTSCIACLNEVTMCGVNENNLIYMVIIAVKLEIVSRKYQ